MKKINLLSSILIVSTVLIISNAAYSNSPVTDENQNICQNLEQNKELEKRYPGYYYFVEAMCKLDNINDANSFNHVIALLNKSTANKYPLSYLAIANLYLSKYQKGSLVYGVKGTRNDLIIAINNYEKAAEAGSAVAQNNLGGEIYLDQLNINDAHKVESEGATYDTNDKNLPLESPVPNIDKAIYWLTQAAKNGNPAAQGTLSDLYLKGIGVPQDYVLAYVWQSISTASQTRFNPVMQGAILNRNLITLSNESDRKIRDSIYNQLTTEQKNEAQNLLREYTKNYFKEPSKFDKACQFTQTLISSKNVTKMFRIANQVRNKAN